MRRGEVWWALAGLLAVCALAAAAMPAAAQKPRAERPTYALGETWLRNDGAYALVRIDRNVYIFSAGAGREVHLTKDLVVEKAQRDGEAVEFRPAPRLSWPLEVGKFGAETGLWRAPGTPMAVTAKLTWHVDAYEDIRASSATFKAFRVSYRIEVTALPGLGSAQRLWTFQTWYVPQLRQLAKIEGHNIGALAFELVSAEPPAVAPAPPPVPIVATPAVPPPPLTMPLVVPERWAVVIGVGQYDNRQIPALRYAVPDAEAIYQTLIGPAGFKKEHVLLLTDTSERKPTLRNIKWALGNFLARSAGKNDTVLVFFAGHGAPELDQRGLERDGLSKYLVPIDADPDDLFSTALPMDDIQTIFGRIEAERVVIFLDACYSGAAGGRTFASNKTRTRDISVDEGFLDRLTRSKGRVIVTASRASEVSIELQELGHGIFTYYLVEGLKGAADLNRDGIVSLQELYEYLERQVSRKARSVGGNQRPVMKGEMEGILPLVNVGR
jgi:hypothetical protein